MSAIPAVSMPPPEPPARIDHSPPTATIVPSAFRVAKPSQDRRSRRFSSRTLTMELDAYARSMRAEAIRETEAAAHRRSISGTMKPALASDAGIPPSDSRIESKTPM